MLLDVASIHPDRILLLDAYFSVVVFHGSTIAAWRKQGFHEQPGYESFKSLLEVRLVCHLAVYSKWPGLLCADREQ